MRPRQVQPASATPAPASRVYVTWARKPTSKANGSARATSIQASRSAAPRDPWAGAIAKASPVAPRMRAAGTEPGPSPASAMNASALQADGPRPVTAAPQRPITPSGTNTGCQCSRPPETAGLRTRSQSAMPSGASRPSGKTRRIGQRPRNAQATTPRGKASNRSAAGLNGTTGKAVNRSPSGPATVAMNHQAGPSRRLASSSQGIRAAPRRRRSRKSHTAASQRPTKICPVCRPATTPRAPNPNPAAHSREPVFAPGHATGGSSSVFRRRPLMTAAAPTAPPVAARAIAAPAGRQAPLAAASGASSHSAKPPMPSKARARPGESGGPR